MYLSLSTGLEPWTTGHMQEHGTRESRDHFISVYNLGYCRFKSRCIRYVCDLDDL